jgi:hypothetical protein
MPLAAIVTGMGSIVRYGKEHGDHLALAVATVVLAVREGWLALVLGPFAILLFVLDRRHVDDDIACAKCLHRKDDHQGNCQECLRQEVRGELQRKTPCARFGRARFVAGPSPR